MWTATITKVIKERDEIITQIEFTNEKNSYDLSVSIKNIAEKNKVENTIQTELKRLNELDSIYIEMKAKEKTSMTEKVKHGSMG